MAEPGLARTLSAAGSSSSPGEEELAEFKSAVLAKLALAVGKDPASATDRDWFVATSYAIRDRIIHRWLSAERTSNAQGRKRVYYLSLEFLIGRLLSDVLVNLGIADIARAALGDLGVDPNRLRSAEPDAALGNGGLGRLAACFMESMASLGIPAYGYGIRYDHGLFRQVIKDGWQQEYPEDWLSFGNPWEFARPEVIYDIHFGGRVETIHEAGRAARYVWLPDETIEAVAYDTPIVGWRGRNVNPLRLWTARAVDPVRLDAFNQRRPYRRAGRAVARGGDLESPLPQRRDAGRPRAAAAAGILLRLGLAAGPGGAPPARPTATCISCRNGRRSSSTTPIRASRSPSSCAC